jgi:uncharacterized membrane protein YfhO
MDFEIVTAGKSLLVFHQNHYPRWKALLDGEGVEIKEVNGPFMSVDVPPGKHEVSFRYYMKDLRLLTMASLLFLTAGMVWVYYPKWRKH